MQMDDDDSMISESTTLYDDDQNISNAQPTDLSESWPVCNPSTEVQHDDLDSPINELIDFETWLTSQDSLRRAIRKTGVPNEIRGRVWLILIDQAIGGKYDACALLEEADKTISENQIISGDEETQSILKQIELDINRTMPGHRLFDDGAEGGVKLRRILISYSIHVNRAIAYCQGFNFIVALLLSIFEGDEEKALRGFICIVDHIFPSKFYFDHYLTGARADQFLLADFICDQLVKDAGTAERKIIEGVTSSITLNWFISLFHGAVPTTTRLTILDHFMLDGVKALFRFTMAILYLAFQVTPPLSCEVFTTIRNTAKEMYDVKLLLSIVEQIKLPRDSYFAIRRSFYMVQASFNSDQFYMQSLSNEASRQFVSNKPLSVQQLPDTKPPAMSFISAASLVAHQSLGLASHNRSSFSNITNRSNGPRVCTSSNRSKVCIQNIGKLGRSHIKIMDANVRSNERSLMTPLRNCLVIGISNCGKIIIIARQSSKRNLKTFSEQDLTFQVHEVCTEIFEGFYLEDSRMAIIVTYLGEIFRIDTSKCYADNLASGTETIMLRDSHPIGESEKLKLRLASLDAWTNLLWVYVECEELATNNQHSNSSKSRKPSYTEDGSTSLEQKAEPKSGRIKTNHPYLNDSDQGVSFTPESPQQRINYQKRIIIIDIITFDIFSAFATHQSFGDITKLRTSLVAFCQLENPMSSQFSSRVVRIGPTGRYEHLLSFSDVVDFMINVSETFSKQKSESCEILEDSKRSAISQTYSSFNKLLTRSISLNHDSSTENKEDKHQYRAREKTNSHPGALTSYYRSLINSHSTVSEGTHNQRIKINDTKLLDINQSSLSVDKQQKTKTGSVNGLKKSMSDQSCRGIITSYLGDVEDVVENNYIPVIMTFIFRNGKIALFEFTETYAIHTRESQLDRYDYSRVIDVSKNGTDFIITILTVFDKLIKVVI